MTPAIPDHIVWQNVPGDLALLDTRDGTYHALNGSAADIWRALDAGLAPAAIAAQLAAAHDAPLAKVTHDIAAFLADAAKRGLIAERADLA